MTQFKSLIYFLIFLMLLQSGCTAVGYGIGRQNDIRTAKPSRILMADEIEKGDYVELTLNDGKNIRGRVQYNNVNQNLGIKSFSPDDEGDSYIYLKSIEWTEIAEVRELDIDKEMRSTGYLVGLIIDIGLVLLFMYAYARSGGGAAYYDH